MRVLFWSELYFPFIGGAEIFASNLMAELRERGVEFLVVTSHHDRELPDEDEQEGIAIRRLPFRAAVAGRDVRSFVSCLKRTAEIKRAFAPDLIHVNAIGPSVLFHLKTLTASTAPTLVTMQQEVLAKTGGESLVGETLDASRWVVGCSNAVLEQLRTLRPNIADHSSCIYNGVTPPTLDAAPLPANPNLLCLGRLVPAKGFDVALRAFARVAAEIPDAHLTIAGDGSSREELESLSKELGISSRVDFRGWVDPESVPALLNEASIVLMPSRREGLPVVAVQAAQMARPIIATPVGGLPEVVIDGSTGVIVRVDDVDSLADAIRALCGHRSRAGSMGSEGRVHALTALDWSRTVSLYNELYEKLGEDPYP